MNERGILTTQDEILNARIDEYIFPKNESEFIGTLINRTWHKKLSALICLFETDDNKKYKLLVWNNNDYQPKKSDINFNSKIEKGTRWKCVFNTTKNGSINWLTAEQLK